VVDFDFCQNVDFIFVLPSVNGFPLMLRGTPLEAKACEIVQQVFRKVRKRFAQAGHGGAHPLCLLWGNRSDFAV
jgi:hypothetical protein